MRQEIEISTEPSNQDIADCLAHEMLERVKAERGQIVPLYPFVKAHIRRHHDYQSLVVDIPQS